MKTLFAIAIALLLFHQSASAQWECPTELVVTPISYTCNQAAQTYDVVFTIRSLEPTVDPWVGSFVTADLGTLTLGCESAETGGNPDCFYDYPPVWSWICACDGRSYEKNGYTDFVGCTGLTIVSNNFCDGTYPVSYQLTDIPLGLDVGLTVSVNLAISLPDVFFFCPFFLTLPAPPSPIQPGVISGPATVCGGSSATYSITNVPGATGYQWTVPSGATISGGQGTNTLQVSWGSTSGNVCVSSTTACGISPATCRAVTISPAISIANISTNGLTGTFTVAGGSAQTNGSNYASVAMSLQGNPGVTATLTGAPFTHNEVVGFTAPQAGTYTVVATDASGCSGTGTVVMTGGGGV